MAGSTFCAIKARACAVALAVGSVMLYGSAAEAAPVASLLVGGPKDVYKIEFIAPRHGRATRVGVETAELSFQGTNYGVRALRWDVAGGAAVELGTLGADASQRGYAYAFGSNNLGAVAGYSEKYIGTNDYGFAAVRWMPGSTDAVELGTLGFDDFGDYAAKANAINDAGVTVGWAAKYNAQHKQIGDVAVRWAANSTTAIELGNLQAGTGYQKSEARAVNAAGTAVGTADAYAADNSFRGTRPVRWDANTTAVTELGVIGTDVNGMNHAGAAYLINAAGTAAGYAPKFDAKHIRVGTAALKWAANSTTPIELLPLDPTHTSTYFSTPQGMNDAGVVVGGSSRLQANGISLTQVAVKWMPNSPVPVELGRLTPDEWGIASSQANDVNNFGIVVGHEQQVDPGGGGLDNHAVVWGADNKAIDLNTFLSPLDYRWQLTDALSISDTGIITGTGRFTTNAGDSPVGRGFMIVVPSFGTYGRGDANFDTKINFDDLVILAQHYGQLTNGSVNIGDFDLSGTVDFNDLVTLAQNYNGGLTNLEGVSSDFAADWALAQSLSQSLTPEPTCLAAMAVLPLMRRKRG